MCAMAEEALARLGEKGDLRPGENPEILFGVRGIVAEVVSETFPISAGDVMPEWSLEAHPLAMDSVSFVRMIVAVEKRFGIVVDDADCSVTAMPTVGSVARVVGRYLAGGRGRS